LSNAHSSQLTFAVAPVNWQKVRHAGLEASQPTNHTANRYNLVLVRCGRNKESLPGIAFSLTS